MSKSPYCNKEVMLRRWALVCWGLMVIVIIGRWELPFVQKHDVYNQVTGTRLVIDDVSPTYRVNYVDPEGNKGYVNVEKPLYEEVKPGDTIITKISEWQQNPTHAQITIISISIALQLALLAGALWFEWKLAKFRKVM